MKMLEPRVVTPQGLLCLSDFPVVRYHTGSLAFGSLIIAIVQLIRVALEYLDHKLRGTFSLVLLRMTDLAGYFLIARITMVGVFR